MSSNKKLLKLVWDDESASYHYALYEVTQTNSWVETLVASGGNEWAQRIAEHYGIKVPKEEL